MAIKVYNTLTKKKEEFVPLHPGKAYMLSLIHISEPTRRS